MRTKVTKENLSKLSHKEQVKFALFCAKQVEHLIAAKEAKNCIEVIEQWLKGEASQEECRKAAIAADAYAYAARTAIGEAADDAVFTPTYAIHTAYDARAAAKKSNKTKITKEQEEYLYELINIDSIVEKNLLA